jgi:hypothetical protein
MFKDGAWRNKFPAVFQGQAKPSAMQDSCSQLILTCTSLHHSCRSQHPLHTAAKRHKLRHCWLHIATAATLCSGAAAACWLTLPLLRWLHYCWRLRQAVHRQLTQHGNIMRLQVSWRVVRQQRE